MVNVSFIEVLVFEECRYPYMFQLADGYRAFRLTFFLGELLYGVLGIYLLVRHRGHERFIIRSHSTFVVSMISYFCAAFSFSLGDVSSNNVSVINQCEVNEGLAIFATGSYAWVFAVRVLLYYNRFQLYKAVVEENEDSRTTRNSKDSESFQRLFFRASSCYAKKLSCIALLSSAFMALASVLIICPQPNIPAISCSFDRGNNWIAVLKYALFGVLLTVFSVVLTVKTTSYPDPFGVLREAKVLLCIYFLSFLISVIALEVALKPVEKFDRWATPTLFASLTNVLALSVTVVYPSYLISRKEATVTYSLEDILSKPEAKRLFEKHLGTELNLEVLHCYEAIQKFSSMFDTSSDEVLLSFANNIHRKFISSETAKFPINISRALRQNIGNKVENAQLTETMFDAVATKLLRQLRYDIFPRFQRGPYYALYVGLSNLKQFQRLEDIRRTSNLSLL